MNTRIEQKAEENAVAACWCGVYRWNATLLVGKWRLGGAFSALLTRFRMAKNFCSKEK